MPIRVSPDEPRLTHHFSLTDRNKTRLGLTVCDTQGNPKGFHDSDIYIKTPIVTTASKQTTGMSSYDIFEYPYSPIVQDDLSGGRANLDFERDSTRYYDSFRTLSGRANKACAGPLEQYAPWASGLRTLNESLPGSVKWVTLSGDQRYLYKRFQASGNFTVGLDWLLVKRAGKPVDMTVSIYADNSGTVGGFMKSITVPYTRMADTLMEWLNETISQVLASGIYYWLIVDGGEHAIPEKNHWDVACKAAVGTTYSSNVFTSTPGAATFDLYFRLTPANIEKTCIPFEYKEGQYFAVSGATGAPNIYMAGDRGAADSNAGQLNKLLDATKNWTPNEWVGQPVMITDGAGKLENRKWRTITSNDASSLTVDSAWKITHDTTTEYIIFGTKIKEIAGHGLTAPVTSVCVSPTGVIYFCMGDSVTVRRLQAYNDAGTWREFGDALCQADETATTKAMYMTFKPQAQKIVIANNSDVSGNVSVSFMSNASVPAWGTALTWAAAKNVDSKYRRINGMIIQPDSQGVEQVLVWKTDLPYFVPEASAPYSMDIQELKNVRSDDNGKFLMRHNTYLYAPILQGILRYYGGQFEGVGPNKGEGMPSIRRGQVVSMIGYPDKFFIGIDAGDTGYSSVMDSGGWHERYRAPKGQRILAMAFQVIPGAALDRLWVYQGNDLIWLPFPSNSTNELEDPNFEYAPEYAVELARMHAGMYDVQKIVKKIKLQTENLQVDANGEPVCWFELDYKLDDDAEWTSMGDIFKSSPTQEIDFTEQFGIAGRRLKIRLRGYTSDKSKSPVFLAIIISAVIRVDVKNFYGPYNLLIMDDQPIGLREEESMSAGKKLKILEDWGDASNDSMLLLNSAARLCDKKMVFMNVGTRRQVGFEDPSNNEFKPNRYVVDVSFWEA